MMGRRGDETGCEVKSKEDQSEEWNIGRCESQSN
jgi:hypothetical protein